MPVWSGTSLVVVWESSLAAIKGEATAGADASVETVAKALARLLALAG